MYILGGIDLPIYVIVGFMQIYQFNQQHQKMICFLDQM